jgi:uncharacterized membrane protein
MKNLLFILPLLILSCSNIDTNKNTTNDSIISTKDTTTVTLDTFQKSTKTPVGIYQVMLPCEDCKGIEHTVSFKQDLTYRLEEKKWGKKVVAKSEGRWQPNEGKIWLYQNDSVKARYIWKGDTLCYLFPEENTVALRRLTPATDNLTWQKKAEKGVDFFGVGNEPFWNVEIDDQKNIAFHLAEWKTPKIFKPVLPTFSDDKIIYNLKTDSSTLNITIFNNFCSDGMSDFIYNNSVKVVYNNQVYNGCGILFDN